MICYKRNKLINGIDMSKMKDRGPGVVWPTGKEGNVSPGSRNWTFRVGELGLARVVPRECGSFLPPCHLFVSRHA